MNMEISFSSLTHPSQMMVGCKVRQRFEVFTRTSTLRCHQALAMEPFSSVPKSGHMATDSGPGGLRSARSDIVGIIGGASVESALRFAKKLESMDEEIGVPFVMCCDPLLSKSILSYERSSIPFLSGRCRANPKADDRWIVDMLRKKRAFLEDSGARCVVMPCHIGHSWYDDVAGESSVKFLHMGECVAKELKEAKLRPLEAGSPLRIGVLATNTDLTAGFYKQKLQAEGFEVVLPDKATIEHTIIPAVEALGRDDIEGAQNLFRIALQVLFVRAVNTVIIASDDIREVLPADDPLLKKCIDPLDALARSTVKYVQSVGKV